MSGKPYVVIIGLLLVVVILLNLPRPEALRAKAAVRDNLTPFQNVVTAVLRQVRGLVWHVSAAWHAADTERSLRMENAELRRELWRLRALQEENTLLRELAGFRKQRRERLLVAEVVARGDAGGWWQTLRLNRGSADGVRANMAVITGRGLVGRTREVSRHTCDVLMITDPTAQVSCRVGTGGAFGILHGAGVTFSGDPRLAMLAAAPELALGYLDATLAIAPNDEVFTSGLGGTYPEGIPVGRIQSVRLDPSHLFLNAVVKPAAELSNLHYVFIVQAAGSGGADS